MILITRAEAKLDGSTSFFTGRVCNRGHISKRWTSTGMCTDCAKLHGKKRDRSKVAAYARSRYRSKSEHCKAVSRAWKSRNLQVRLTHNRNRRAKLKLAEGFHSAADIQALLVQQNTRCLCSFDLSRGFHVDHVVPISRGGSNWSSNLQLLCQPCNDSKGAKTMDEWVDRLRRAV